MTSEMKTKTFTPGQTVALRSGGPGMTVVDVGQHSGLVFCRLGTASGEFAEHSFPAETLTTDPRSAFATRG